MRQLARELAARIGALASPTIPSLRALRRELSRELSGVGAHELLEVATALVPVNRFIAYELIAVRRDAMELLDEPRLRALGSDMASWDAVDTFAVYLSGVAWREGRIGDKVIASWARSHDRWWRRAALVSTVPLNQKSRGGNGDVGRTLAVCTMLLDDRDDMVVKAMSWALRELAKRNAAAARTFLAENEPRLAARVLREVRTKLTTGRKNG